MRGSVLGIVLALALGLTVGRPAHVAGARAQPGSRAHVEIRVTGQSVGRPIPAGFLGISIEFSSLYAYAGSDPAAPNPVLLRLLDGLAPGQRPVLRIGGDSTDRTWWPLPGTMTPPWASYTLTTRWIAMARAVTDATHAHLILGINLLANSTTIASAEAEAFLRGIGRRRIAAFEIGNEPELYSTQTWYRTMGGRPVTGRRPGYDLRTYLREAARIRSALAHFGPPRIALAGPATGTLPWLSSLRSLLIAEPALAQVTLHRYPLNRCVATPSSPLHPTVAHLLSLGSSAGLVRGIGPYVALAHGHRAGFLVDELNAVTCGGQTGVSNTFAAALWTLDTQFWMARVGVDGVDVHIHPQAPSNQLFTFTRRDGRWVGSVRPQYYGLLMFARAAPPGSDLLRVTGRPGPLRVWATRARDGRIRVVLINAGPTRARTASVAVADGGAPATLERLEAPSARATGGVTLGGRSFGSHTLTGILARPVAAPAVRATGGSYRIQMPAGSAAMLTVPSG